MSVVQQERTAVGTEGSFSYYISIKGSAESVKMLNVLEWPTKLPKTSSWVLVLEMSQQLAVSLKSFGELPDWFIESLADIGFEVDVLWTDELKTYSQERGNSFAVFDAYVTASQLAIAPASFPSVDELELARSSWMRVLNSDEPVFVQCWVNPDGTIEDSVTWPGLTRDVFLTADADDNHDDC